MSIKSTAKKTLGIALSTKDQRDEAVRFEAECAQERASRVDRSAAAEARHHEASEKLRVAENDESVTSEELVPLRATVALTLADEQREANFCRRADEKWEAARRAVAIAQGAFEFERAMTAKGEIAKALPPVLKAIEAFNVLIEGNRTLREAFADSQIGSSVILTTSISWLERFREELRGSAPLSAPMFSVVVEIIKSYSSDGSLASPGQYQIGEHVAVARDHAARMIKAGIAVAV